MKDKILEEAFGILHERNEEKERQYGPFSEGIDRAAQIATGMLGREITATDIYKILVALKLSRDSYNPKYDNILDAVVYLSQIVEHDTKSYKSDKWTLWDLDGTLIDSMPEHKRAYKLAIEKHGFDYQDEVIDNFLPHGITTVLDKLHIEPTKHESIRKLKHTLFNWDNVKPRTELIKRLVDTPRRTGIITNAWKGTLDEAVGRFDIPMWGVEYVDTRAGKPEREAALRFLIKTNARPQDVMYVGDSHMDYRWAERVGFGFTHYEKAQEILNGNT